MAYTSKIAREVAKALEKVPRRSQSREGSCHICQRKTVVEPWEFALVKILSVKYDLLGVGKNFVVSTVLSIPLSFIGLRAFPNIIPGKTTKGDLLSS